ncbi:MAG: serine hydrolase [Planctomycetota bacterium]|nr:serine hydrolase [Planctomycetota bacterium]
MSLENQIREGIEMMSLGLRRTHLIVVGGLLLVMSHVSAQVASPEQTETLAKINALIEQALSETGAVGYSVAVALDDGTIFAKGYGLAEVEHQVEADAETTFRIGSVTKQFTAAAVMKLIEDGKLALDDELSEFFPDFPTQDHVVTIEHLLTHTSGIKSYTGVPKFWEEGSTRELSVQQLLDYVDVVPLEFTPGEKFAYNNSAYYILGAIIEQASGVPYCQYLQDEFFTPLSLERTMCDSNAKIISNRAQGYRMDGGTLVNDQLIGMDNPGAAGMLLGTARDLVLWNMALMKGMVVSLESLEKMCTPYTLNDGEETGYGYGLGIGEFEGHRRISHNGGIHGFNSTLAYYPDDDLYIAVISNGAASAGKLGTQIAREVLGIPLEVASKSLSEEEIASFVGVYHIEQMDVDIKIYLEDDALYLKPEREGQDALKLLYQGEGEFRAEPDPEIRIVFDISNGDGPAPAFILHQGGQQIWATRKDED